MQGPVLSVFYFVFWWNDIYVLGFHIKVLDGGGNVGWLQHNGAALSDVECTIHLHHGRRHSSQYGTR